MRNGLIFLVAIPAAVCFFLKKMEVGLLNLLISNIKIPTPLSFLHVSYRNSRGEVVTISRELILVDHICDSHDLSD